jgi:DNA-binding NtrC family response regulator
MTREAGKTIPVSALLKIAAPASVELPTCHLEVVEGPGAGRAFGPLGKVTLIGREGWCDVALDAPEVSARHCEVRLEPGAVRLKDRRSTNGTWLGTHRIGEAWLADGDRFRVGRSVIAAHVAGDSRAVDVSPMDITGTVLGRSEPMLEVLDLLRRVAGRKVHVLITGETGTGKTCVARALHQASGRGSFVKVNCGALPEGLIESELFGHERGAFTGADGRRVGLFEAADAGTIFLDEIAELPLHLQPRLLTVLEDQCIRRVGSSTDVKVDFRLVAATNRDLERAAERGEFRRDLYYRLTVVEVELPPLRQRLEDLPLLAEYLFARALAEGGMPSCRLSPDALDHLVAHDWPGNVRELDNTIRRAVALAEGDVLGPDDLRVARTLRAQRAGEFDSSLPFREFKEQVLEYHEKAYIAELIEACTGNVSEAARRSGLSRQHLFTLLKKYGLRDD